MVEGRVQADGYGVQARVRASRRLSAEMPRDVPSNRRAQHPASKASRWLDECDAGDRAISRRGLTPERRMSEHDAAALLRGKPGDAVGARSALSRLGEGKSVRAKLRHAEAMTGTPE